MTQDQYDAWVKRTFPSMPYTMEKIRDDANKFHAHDFRW